MQELAQRLVVICYAWSEVSWQNKIKKQVSHETCQDTDTAAVEAEQATVERSNNSQLQNSFTAADVSKDWYEQQGNSNNTLT